LGEFFLERSLSFRISEKNYKERKSKNKHRREDISADIMDGSKNVSNRKVSVLRKKRGCFKRKKPRNVR